MNAWNEANEADNRLAAREARAEQRQAEARAAYSAAEKQRDTTMHEVQVTLNDADLATIALGLGETSTQAQRALAREALGSLIRQAMEAITERIVGYERPSEGEKCAATDCGETMIREVLDLSFSMGTDRRFVPGRWVCPVHG